VNKCAPFRRTLCDVVGAPDQRRQLIAEHQRLAGDSGSPIWACPIKGIPLSIRPYHGSRP
jgi:hypothetical protein